MIFPSLSIRYPLPLTFLPFLSIISLFLSLLIMMLPLRSLSNSPMISLTSNLLALYVNSSGIFPPNLSSNTFYSLILPLLSTRFPSLSTRNPSLLILLPSLSMFWPSLSFLFPIISSPSESLSKYPLTSCGLKLNFSKLNGNGSSPLSSSSFLLNIFCLYSFSTTSPVLSSIR